MSDTELREGIRMTSDDFEKIFFNGCTITPLIQHSLDKVDGFRLKVRQIQRGTRNSQKFSNKCRVKDFLWDVTYELWKKEMHPFYRKAYKQTGYSQYEYQDLEKKQSFLHVQLSIQVHLDSCPLTLFQTLLHHL